MNNRNKLIVGSLKEIGNHKLMLRENDISRMSHINLNQSFCLLRHEYLFLVTFGDDLLANIDLHYSCVSLN